MHRILAEPGAVRELSKAELSKLIFQFTQKSLGQEPSLDLEPLYLAARETAYAHYGKQVFLRGLVEISSYCKQNCYYCGLRKENTKAVRYRLDSSEILECCETGYELGFRSFVLQGGEDGQFTDSILCNVIEGIKSRWPDSAVTLSLGERSKESYRNLKNAGADRYLLRHESADAQHFASLHPAGQSLASRRNCLYDLKDVGFQTGAGFMVGSPGQEPRHLAEDLYFLKELEPHMVGIGPFIPHEDTPFASYSAGSLQLTLFLLALTRLLLPQVLLPATTALASIHPDGRKLGFAAGANVVMPNLSPSEVRPAYQLYNGKRSSGSEAAEGLQLLQEEIRSVGWIPMLSRGDHKTVLQE